jgi:predicted DCC family thiol-disulfide oxidoreductase YuxK
MKKILIIDGDCRFCLGSTKLLRRMLAVPLHVITQHHLEYAAFQKQFNASEWAIDSIKLIVDDKLFMKSRAISTLLVGAHWYYQPIRIFFLLPTFVLDRIYDFIARNRYLWGKGGSCEII